MKHGIIVRKEGAHGYSYLEALIYLLYRACGIPNLNYSRHGPCFVIRRQIIERLKQDKDQFSSLMRSVGEIV